MAGAGAGAGAAAGAEAGRGRGRVLIVASKPGASVSRSVLCVSCVWRRCQCRLLLLARW